MESRIVDVLIIGAGLAGCAAALELAPHCEVALISKAPSQASNSYHAQGGIAAAIDPADTPYLHAVDTLAAGHGLCYPSTVLRLTRAAPERMRWLQSLGVPFDVHAETGRPRLGLEGAHSHRRILHAGGDASGRVVMETVLARLQEQQVIRCARHLTHSLLVGTDGRVHGAVVTDLATGREQWWFARRATVLATGGAGQLYRYTTNPIGATGDGIALAYAAGAGIRNLEFIQFHPTALAAGSNPRFLISEAVRGAGAVLVNDCGHRIMAGHPQADLAPRDVVARAIYEEMQQGRRVFLDARSIPSFAEHFPTIDAFCRNLGLLPSRDLLPVSPAAHFVMGGVDADLDGSTSVAGLYAIGEVAHTGVHGANRLASNSLLECLVMAHELAERLKRAEPTSVREVSVRPAGWFEPCPDEVLESVRDVMWEDVGIIRTADGLRRAQSALHHLHAACPTAAPVHVGRLVVACARLREESRGAHYRSDAPHANPSWAGVDTCLTPESEALVHG
ncbi:L-aspartate oxidase [Alicyclobacillus contaminans]|uniref:L-aspartate oxidase n=1 Tax=Alicyclobacillus contaminans TaxID=392016 RepID=UPI0004053CC3|nr:L-aspartate oxidase [Alicyclobacillus contaminans]GMA49735.1 L-aspartate oxidase [Alicyclobacillus contaminans]